MVAVKRKVTAEALYAKAGNLVTEASDLIMNTAEMLADRKGRYARAQELAENRTKILEDRIKTTRAEYRRDPEHADRYETSIEKQRIILGAFEKTAEVASKALKEVGEIQSDLGVLTTGIETVSMALYGKEQRFAGPKTISKTMGSTADYMKDTAERLVRHDKSLAAQYVKVAEQMEKVSDLLKKAAPPAKQAAKAKAEAEATA